MARHLKDYCNELRPGLYGHLGFVDPTIIKNADLLVDPVNDEINLLVCIRLFDRKDLEDNSYKSKWTPRVRQIFEAFMGKPYLEKSRND